MTRCGIGLARGAPWTGPWTDKSLGACAVAWQARDAEGPLDALETAIKQVKDNDKFRKVLETVLAIGNYMNGGTCALGRRWASQALAPTLPLLSLTLPPPSSRRRLRLQDRHSGQVGDGEELGQFAHPA